LWHGLRSRGRRHGLGLQHRLCVLHRATETGGHHRDPHFAAHGRIEHRAHHHRGVLVSEGFHRRAHFLEFADGEVHAGGDVHQHALGAGEVHVLQQRALQRRLGRAHRAVLADGDSGTHHGHAHLRHDRAHVGEVHVDETRPGDDVRDALHRAQQHLIGRLEGVDEGDLAAQHRSQLVVGDHDQGIDVLGQFGDALLRREHALVALEAEGLGHHRHHQDVHLLRHLRHHRRGAGTGAAAHTGGDEHHVGALQHLLDAVAVLEGRLAAHVRVGAGAQALGEAAADLQGGLGVGLAQHLGVGVDGDEVDALDALGHHVLDGVAATAAHADDLDHRVLGHVIH
jgi:hypothetical protein